MSFQNYYTVNMNIQINIFDLENVRLRFKPEILLSDFSKKCNIFLLSREV